MTCNKSHCGNSSNIGYNLLIALVRVSNQCISSSTTEISMARTPSQQSQELMKRLDRLLLKNENDSS